jgi:hypothetical protein
MTQTAASPTLADPQQPRSERYHETIVPFTAGDGLACNLVRVQGDRPAPKGPVIVVHGAGVRANLFRPPVPTTFVDYLVENGYDVWLENWRASIDLAPNEWTLDQAAVFDHPQAVKTIVRETGSDQIKAVIHCQGSTSFMMSALAGLVPEVTTIVSNAVSLHTHAPGLSFFKLGFVLPVGGLFTRYLNPQWGVYAPSWFPRFISAVVEATHHECNNSVCKQISFTYGSGFPALWSHANLSDATHEWIKQEFAAVPIKFFKQMARCVQNGHLVSVDNLPELPLDFAAQPARTQARFALFAGADNLCFLPDSQVQTFQWLEAQRSGFHSVHVVPGYGHLDVFLGENAVRDTFPLMLAELDAPSSGRAP